MQVVLYENDILIMNSPYSIISNNFKVEFFKLEDFINIPEVPGIYSWHLACNLLDDSVTSFHKFYKIKSFDIFLSGFLQEKYSGKVQSDELNFSELSFESELLRLSSAVFAPSIYVGIATKNLNQRLHKHKSQLLKILSNKDKACEISKSLSDEFKENIERGEDVNESNYFAYRFGKLICELNLDILEDDIFVKTVQLPNSFSKKEIRNTEKIINRTYHPLLGRR